MWNFAQKGQMKTHISSVHDKKKPFKCEICDKEFTLKQSMAKHIVSIHEKM